MLLSGPRSCRARKPELNDSKVQGLSADHLSPWDTVLACPEVPACSRTRSFMRAFVQGMFAEFLLCRHVGQMPVIQN